MRELYFEPNSYSEVSQETNDFPARLSVEIWSEIGSSKIAKISDKELASENFQIAELNVSHDRKENLQKSDQKESREYFGNLNKMSLLAGASVLSMAALHKFVPAQSTGSLARTASEIASTKIAKVGAEAKSIGTLAEIPSYNSLISQMRAGQIGVKDILASRTETELINTGSYANVYNIPQLPDFVIREPKISLPVRISPSGGGPRLEAVEDWAPEHNFGQAVAKIGNVEILKRVQGDPYPYAKDWGKTLTDAQRSQEFAKTLSEISQWPQEAYTDFAYKLVVARDNGRIFDKFNQNNILIDRANKRFNLIDFEIPSHHHGELSSDFMLQPLFSSKLAEKLPIATGWQKPGVLPYPDIPSAGSLNIGSPYFREYRNILDKTRIAAREVGLEADHSELLKQVAAAGYDSKYYLQFLHETGVTGTVPRYLQNRLKAFEAMP